MQNHYREQHAFKALLYTHIRYGYGPIIHDSPTVYCLLTRRSVILMQSEVGLYIGHIITEAFDGGAIPCGHTAQVSQTPLQIHHSHEIIDFKPVQK